jgi:hypothetical protein
MFRSARRSVVFPQAEHARLAGELALLWGNERFPRPALPFDRFVKGVALHDRGYGGLDDDEIGAVAADRWIAIQRRGFRAAGDDPVVDLVVALHVRRLVSGSTGQAEALAEMDAALPALHEAAGASPRDAGEADRITNLCDMLSFDLCVEEALDGGVTVAGIEVGYRMDGAGTVEVDPWPFSAPFIEGLLLGYEAHGYPDRLAPVPTPYRLRPTT